MATTTIVAVRNVSDFLATAVNFERPEQTDGSKGQFPPGEWRGANITVPWCGDGVGFRTRHIDITLSNFVIGTTPVPPRVFTVWQAWRPDGDRVRVSMDGSWRDPGDTVGGMAAVGIVESWVLQADNRVLYITNDALWLFPLWFMDRINDLKTFVRSDGCHIHDVKPQPSVPSVPKLAASAFSMAGIPSDAFDSHQPDARFLYRDSGKRYEFNIVNGVVQVQPPLTVPSITPGAPVPALTQAISYQELRGGAPVTLPQFDLVAANGGRVFAKEKDSNRFFFAILDEMFIHSTLDLPEFAVPSVYFKLDPEFNLGRSQQDLMSPLQGMFGRHPAASRFAVYRMLLDFELAPLFVVRVKRGAWHLIDGRPAPINKLGEAATKLSGFLAGNPALVTAVPELFRRLTNWANMMRRPEPPPGTPYLASVAYGFADRNRPPVNESSIDQAFQKVLDIGVGHVHYHQQAEGRWSQTQFVSGVAGGEFQLVFGRFEDNPFPDHHSLYQFFNGPVTDLDGYNDGTCNYYVLAQLTNGTIALLYIDEQTVFSGRWRLVDPDDSVGSATALAGDLAALPTGYTPAWRRELFWSPFAAPQLVGPTSRLAVSTQVVLVSGDKDKEPNTIYSINFSYGSCDQTWRWRRLPASATPKFFSSDAEAAAEVIPPGAGDTIYPQTIRLRDDMTIHIKGTCGGVVGRWYQRYLPPSNQLMPQLNQLIGGRPTSGFQHPWKFIDEPAFQLADRFSHFGVYDQVDSRSQYYPVQPATAADATALTAVAADPQDRWSDVVWTESRVRPPPGEPGGEVSWAKGPPQLAVQTFSFTVDKLQLPWPPFAPFLKDTALCPASLFNPEALLRIVWRDTRWIAMRRDKRDDDLAPFDNLPRRMQVQNKTWDKTATVTLQPGVRISDPPAVQTAYFWIVGNDAVVAISGPMTIVPLDNVYRLRMAALGTAAGEVIGLLDVTAAQLQPVSGHLQYRWTPSVAELEKLRSYCSAQGERQHGTSIWFEDVVGHVAVPEKLHWQRSPWIQVTVTPSLVALGTPTQITVYAADGGTGAPLAGQVMIVGTVVANTGTAFAYTFNSAPGSGVVRAPGYVETPFAVNVVQALNAAFVGQSVPSTMIGGQSYGVSVTMRNAGGTAWTSGGANPFRLGAQNPQDNTTWGFGRREVPGTVAPGATVTFSFNVTAPNVGAAGTYHFQWRMVQELVTWFGDFTPDVAVSVIPALTVSANPSTIYEGRRAGVTVSSKDARTGTDVAGRVWIDGVDTAATNKAFTHTYNGAETLTVRAPGYPETKVTVSFYSP